MRDPFRYSTTMIFKFHETKDTSHLKEEWVPLIYKIVNNGYIFNWGSIPYINMEDVLSKCKKYTIQKPKGFYMASYLIEIVCASNPFPNLRWNWNLLLKPY